MATLFIPSFGSAMYLGLPAAGAKLYFYDTLTLNLINIYDGAGTLLANPISADLFGNFPAIYIGDSTLTYRVRLTTSSGSTIKDFDPVDNLGGRLAGIYSAFSAGTGASLLGYNRGVTGSRDRTVQSVLREEVRLMDFYQSSDPDLTNAFNAAIAYANGTSGNVNILLGSVQGTVSAGLTPITVPEVSFVGSGSGTVLNVTANAALFEWRAYGGGLESLIVNYPSAPGANAVVNYQNGGDGQNFINLRVFNARTIHKAGADNGSSIGNAFTYHNVKGNVYNGGSPAFKLNKCSGVFLDTVQLYVAGVGVPATNRISTMTTVSGTNLIDAGAYTVDTIEISGACIFERFYRGLNFQLGTASQVILNVIVSPTTIFDYIREDVYHFETQLGSGGINTSVISGYAMSWEGRAVHVMGPAGNRDHQFLNMIIPCSGYEGILFEGSGWSYNQIHGGKIFASNRLNTGKAGIRLQDTGVGQFSIKDIATGLDGTFGGLPWQATYGVSLMADLNNYVISGVNAQGATAGWDLPANSSPSSARLIINNVAPTYAGRKTGSAGYIDPGAGVSWNNTTSNAVTFSACGATVNSVAKNGHVVCFTGGGSTRLMPGEGASYNGAATFVEFYVDP